MYKDEPLCCTVPGKTSLLLLVYVVGDESKIFLISLFNTGWGGVSLVRKEIQMDVCTSVKPCRSERLVRLGRSSAGSCLKSRHLPCRRSFDPASFVGPSPTMQATADLYLARILRSNVVR
jgi:hypothetical protein